MVLVTTKPIDFFQPDPSNPRNDLPEDELLLLGESLKKKQLVLVIAGMFRMILDVEHQRRVAKLVGSFHITATVQQSNFPPDFAVLFRVP
jgi:hypothetical protein